MFRVEYIVLLIFFSFCESARILILVPTPSISHQVVFRPLVQELANRGHDVIYITTDPAYPKGSAPANITEIDVHDYSYEKWRPFMGTTSGNADLYTQLEVLFTVMNGIVIDQILMPEVQKIINDNSKPIDLVMVEAVVRPALILSHLIKAPLVQISSFGATTDNYKTVGAPVHPILYPEFFRYKIYNFTFWEKLTELYTVYKLLNLYDYRDRLMDAKLKLTFGPDTPTLRELSNNVEMLFLNINPIWEGNHPVPPSVVYMGGLHQIPKKTLPEDLQRYLDSSTNGVIYMSLGTNVTPSQLPRDIIQMFINVFSKLPYNVLWKWNNETLEGKPDNVKISKWLPQSDLLRHPNVKLFITQGGLQSTDEALTAGVPLIGIPILGDQWYNTEKYPYHGIGVKIDLNDLTEERLNNAINKVIGDKSYKENVKRLHVLMTDQPMKPLDRAIWWIEYVLRHKGAKHLRSPAANITWAEYLELEFCGTLLLLVLSIIVFIYVTFRCSMKIIRSFTSVKAKTS